MLSDLSEIEMDLFRFGYNRHHRGFIIHDTKKSIKEVIRDWKQRDWPKKVVDRLEFGLYVKLEQEQKAKISHEKKEYRRLKRKYG